MNHARRSGLLLALLAACTSFGQTSPGARSLHAPPPNPELFAAGRVSTPWQERDAAISPDGSIWMHTVLGDRGGTVVMRSLMGEALGPLELAPFSGVHDDLEPCFDPRGDRLWFASRRPRPGVAGPASWNLWWVNRSADGGWSEPTCFAAVDDGKDEFYPSLTQDGVLYFTAVRDGSSGGEDIFRVRTDRVGPVVPEGLGPAINSDGPEYNAFVAADESFLVYSAEREGDLGRGDLRVAFRLADGSWTDSVNLGPDVNSAALDYCPFVSPDGSTLYFSSNRPVLAHTLPDCTDATPQLLARGPAAGRGDIYQVSMEVVMRHRPERTLR
jgi:hypothetical protein